MKKFLVLLLVCILVFSITVCLSSCRRNKQPENPEDPNGGTVTPPVEQTPSVDSNGGTSGGKIELPPVKIPGQTPTEDGEVTE